MNIYAFGAFRLHAERLTLKNRRGPIALGPRVVETLLALVERPGQTLSKAQLLDRVWPEGFVEEANLTQNIYVLRKTLRDGGLGDAIETVPRVGYRFTAPVKRIGEPPRRSIAAAALAAAFIVAALIFATSLGLGHRHAGGAALSANGARLYEVGRYYWELRTREGVRKSLEYFARVVDADPANARGYAALADANVAMGDYCYGTHMPQIYFGRARAYAEKALALDPDSAEAHATLGFLSMESGDAASAMSELRRSLAVDAANSTTHTWYAIALTQSGRPEEALRELQAAQRLDPLSVVASVWLSSEAYRRGQFGEAVRYARQTLELSPRRLDALRILGESYEAQGDFKSAIATFKQIGAVGAYYHPYAAELLARAYELDGQKALARIQLAYARTHLREHRTATEDASGLLFRRNIGALVLFRTDPNRLDVDELVYSKG